MPERIFVVGHAAVTCLGRDMNATWRALIAGRSGIRRHATLGGDKFLQDIGGMVEDFGPGSTTEDPAVAKLASRFIHLAMAAARGAWTDAGLDRLEGQFDPNKAAVVVGSAFGGLDLLEAEQDRMIRRRSLAVSPYLVPAMIINQAAGQVAQHLRLYGPSAAPANACASGGHAVALGAMYLRSGDAELAVCGAGESAFTPFSVDRAGFVLSEGAGALVLATESAVRRLGLESQAELLGWCTNTDGYHMAMPCRERIRHCLTAALARSEVTPEQIDYYNAHGTSTSLNDRVETQVLKDVFGEKVQQLAVSSVKGALGHSLGAASAIEAAVSVRALREQIIPPTINLVPDPELDLDYVPNQARPARLDVVLSAAFGFGGTNNALVLRRTTP
jgi:3-oxoacyl-[acyl-carrier-protein] synthase II